VNCPPHLTLPIARELAGTGLAVRVGKVWATDAPYRETNRQLEKWAREGALAVEMQAASLFAFGDTPGTGLPSLDRYRQRCSHHTGGAADPSAILLRRMLLLRLDHYRIHHYGVWARLFQRRG
jgi:hypothetical protein